jgi:large subunit ribosomal protein L29
MRASELREQTVEELRDREISLAEQLFALRLQKVTGQLENPAKIPAVRRDLARVLTVLREKESAQS